MDAMGGDHAPGVIVQGTLLLGVKGVGIICHGGFSSKAIKNAIRIATDFVNNHIQERLEQWMAKF